MYVFKVIFDWMYFLSTFIKIIIIDVMISFFEKDFSHDIQLNVIVHIIASSLYIRSFENGRE